MSFEVRTTPDFERSLKRVAKKFKSIRDDILILVKQLKKEPYTGTQLSSNLYKIRLNISSSNKGKSGGARVITYVLVSKEVVLLSEIFIKSEADTVDEKSMIKRLTDQGLI